MDSLRELLAAAERFFQDVPGEKVVFADDLSAALAPCKNEKTVVFSGTHYAETLRKAGFSVWSGVEAEPACQTVEVMASYLRQENPDAFDCGHHL